MEQYFSSLISAYRKNCSSQPAIIRSTEEWTKKLDNNFVEGAVLIDWSKAFNCKTCCTLPLTYILSYLSNLKLYVRIKNTDSEFENVIRGAPQGSILGPLFTGLYIVQSINKRTQKYFCLSVQCS